MKIKYKTMKSLIITLSIFFGFGCSTIGSQEHQQENLETKVVQTSSVNDTTKTSKYDLYVDTTKYKKKCIRHDYRYRLSFKNLKKFNTWIDSTLTQSARKNKKAIIINKSEYTLYLIDSGKVHSKYFIELGGNPFDDKYYEGDGCTPEGLYRVQEKKDKKHTIFHKAYLINYPNKQDLKNGKTGSLIEIHGGGSGKKGDDVTEEGWGNWTFGCIALSDSDMDIIFPYINKGDRITIIRYTSIDLKYQ